jgi:hypothetical protein
MAIQPIDLQTLFTQVDKVAKTQSALREGAAIQQSIQGVHLQEKTEERIQEVNEAQNMGEGTQKVKDRGAREQDSDRKKKQSGETEEEDEEEKKAKPSIFRDPTLGHNIDISL